MKKNYRKTDVCCIIVCYRVKIVDFIDIINLHLKNYSKVILVNNSNKFSIPSFASHKIILINNSSNLGLAKGLNQGIIKAKSLGFKLVSLFDQDTLIPPNFLNSMLQYINNYKSTNKVGAFSPVFFNHVTDEIGKHIGFKPFRLIR